MPGLNWCGKQWKIGSDDFVFPGILELSLRIIWLVTISVVFHIFKDAFSCKGGDTLWMYHIGVITLISVGIVLTVVMMVVSAQGSVMYGHSRRSIPVILYLKVALAVPEIGWNCLGTYWAFRESSGCEWNVVTTVKAVVIFGWIVLVIAFIGIMILLDPVGNKHKESTEDTGNFLMSSVSSAHSAAKQVWERRCKLMFCCVQLDKNHSEAFTDVARLISNFFCCQICKLMFCCVQLDKNHSEAFTDVARLISNFFKHLDLVPTDIAAGFLLLHKQQEILHDSFIVSVNNSPSNQPRRSLSANAVSPSPSGASNLPTRSYSTPASAASQSNIADHSVNIIQSNGSQTKQLSSSHEVNQNDITTTNAVTQQQNTVSASNSATHQQPTTGILNPNNVNLIEVSNSVSNHGDARLGQLSNSVGRSGASGYPTIQPKPWMNIQLLSYYMKFATASYGWPLYMYMNMCTGICKLYGQCREDEYKKEISMNLRYLSRKHTETLKRSQLYGDHRCCSCEPTPDNTHDNACYCNTAALKKVTGLQDDDLIYVSYHNNIYEIPFYVALDRPNRNVVVAIRGTLSLRDYGLVITGHSLGAGAASLLSILLKPQYPNLKCFPYSPPGGLLSASAAVYTQEFTCSVILGKDLIPRLSIPNMDDLKVKLMRTLRACRTPKYKILCGGCCQAAFGFNPVDCQMETGSSREPLISSLNRQYSTIEEALLDSRLANTQANTRAPKLIPPGLIVHITRIKRKKRGTPHVHTAKWSTADKFNEIIISPKMVADHFPDKVMSALQSLADKDFQLDQQDEPLLVV